MTHYTARQYLITLSRDPAVSYDLYGDTRSSDVPLSVINNLFLCVYIYAHKRKDCFVFSITPPATVMISETPARVYSR